MSLEYLRFSPCHSSIERLLRQNRIVLPGSTSKDPLGREDEGLPPLVLSPNQFFHSNESTRRLVHLLSPAQARTADLGCSFAGSSERSEIAEINFCLPMPDSPAEETSDCAPIWITPIVHVTAEALKSLRRNPRAARVVAVFGPRPSAR